MCGRGSSKSHDSVPKVVVHSHSQSCCSWPGNETNEDAVTGVRTTVVKKDGRAHFNLHVRYETRFKADCIEIVEKTAASFTARVKTDL